MRVVGDGERRPQMEVGRERGGRRWRKGGREEAADGGREGGGGSWAAAGERAIVFVRSTVKT
jgi:hypothetical protein